MDLLIRKVYYFKYIQRENLIKIVLICIFFITTFHQNSYAQNLERFCFKNSFSKKQAHSEFSQFKLKDEDLLNVDELCFDLLLSSEKRIHFWTSFIEKRHSGINKTTTHFPLKECHIKMEKITLDNESQKDIQVSRRLNFKNGKTVNTSKEEGFIKVLSRKKAKLSFDNESLEFQCIYKNNNSYEIEFSQKLEDIQNFFYTVNGIPFWKQIKNESQSLQTTIILNKGEKIEIGGISKNKDKNQRNIGFPSGINFQEKDGKLTYRIYLSIQ